MNHPGLQTAMAHCGLIAILLNKKLTEKEVKPIRIAKERYGPLVRKAITRPWPSRYLVPE